MYSFIVKKKAKWGILSTAKISESAIIPAIKSSKNSCLYAVASRDKIKSKIFAKKFKIEKNYSDYKSLYQDPNIDIIYNPLPNHLHLTSTIEAAKNKKNVLLEKPITLKSKDVDKLITVSKKYNIIIKEAFMLRYHQQWKWLKKYITNKSIGDVNSISTNFSFFNDNPKNIRNIKKYGGGSLYDIGCYAVLISRYLLNKEPRRVVATAKYDKKFKTDIVTTGIMDFNNVHSTFTVSTQTALSQKVIITGSKKTIIIENPFNHKKNHSAVITIYNGKSLYNYENAIKTFKPLDQYETQVTNFSNNLLKKTPIDFSLEDSKKNMKVIDALFLSLKNNRWENVR